MASLTTSTPTNLTSTSATLGGSISSDGNATITERGICFSTSQSPTTSNSKVANGSGTGSFSGTITGLTANTTYHVRAYAI
ncbi:MAG: transcription factor, partial [Bacteroidota bacterium]|nr:transcription factor [Bacteroidota bacterium]